MDVRVSRRADGPAQTEGPDGFQHDRACLLIRGLPKNSAASGRSIGARRYEIVDAHVEVLVDGAG